MGTVPSIVVSRQHKKIGLKKKINMKSRMTASKGLGGVKTKGVDAEIAKNFSSLLNPTDVFAPCVKYCVDHRKTRGVTQPYRMHQEVLRLNNTLEDLAHHVQTELERTKQDLRAKLFELKGRDRKAIKVINQITSPTFGTITHVPDATGRSTRAANGKEAPNEETTKIKDIKRKRMERERKARQKNQTRLIATVLEANGRVKPAYRNLFSFETPFGLTEGGKRISRTTGSVVTQYGRTDKRIDPQLRYKVKVALNDALARRETMPKAPKGVNDREAVQRIEQKIKLLRELDDPKLAPHANRPLKLAKTGRTWTVAKGGDHARRELIDLFGIVTIKAMDGKQKYRFSEKTKLVFGISNSNNATNREVTDAILGRIETDRNNARTKFEEFEINQLDEVLQNLLIIYLESALSQRQEFSLHGLTKYELIDIPYVEQYRLHGGLKNFIFQKIGNTSRVELVSEKPKGEDKKIGQLTYKMRDALYDDTTVARGEFVDYTTAVALARRHLRQKRNTVLLKDKAIQRFFLRHEDRHRMDHIKTMLELTKLYRASSAAHRRPSRSPSRARRGSAP